jgi:hypothetical protein
MPISAANTMSITTMPARRASLSCDPKCVIANSLTGIGVRLIAVSPTAITGALFALISAAASSATPSAMAAVSKPASAPASSRRTVARPGGLITGHIRNPWRRGLVHGTTTPFTHGRRDVARAGPAQAAKPSAPGMRSASAAAGNPNSEGRQHQELVRMTSCWVARVIAT